MADSVERLYEAVRAAKSSDPEVSRTAKLLRSGRSKVAKKLAEEAVEVVIDAMNGNNDAVVRESADLIYNLVVLWVSTGIHPREIWEEMTRREELLGIAEKMPKHLGRKAPAAVAGKSAAELPARRKVLPLDRARLRKGR